MRLEAGLAAGRARVGVVQLVEAVALYESHGWHRIEPYGFYADSPLTACYGKDLA